MAISTSTTRLNRFAPVREHETSSPMLRVLPIAAALLGALLYHRYSIASGLDWVQADDGDSRFVVFILEHWNAVLHGREDWRSPPIFFPVPFTLAYSDPLVAMGAIHALLRSIGLPVFAAVNAQLVFCSLASFYAAYVFLVRGFGRSVVAATIGAYFFAYSWPRFAELVHIQLQFTAPIPILGLLALQCLRDGPVMHRAAFAWRALAFAGLFAFLLATTVYYAQFIALFLSIAVLASLAVSGVAAHLWRTIRRHWAALLAAVLLLAVLVAPIAAVFLPVMRQSGGRSWSEVTRFLIHPIDLLWLGRENLAWGWLFDRWPELSQLKWPGSRLGTGAVATLAWAGACLWALRQVCSKFVRPLSADQCNHLIAALVILTAALLQLMALRVAGHSAWWLIYEVFPGMSGVRAVARIELVLTLPIALGIALLVDAAGRSGRLAMVSAIVLAAIGAGEQVGVVQRYSGQRAEAVAERVARAIPPGCRAAYIVAPVGTEPQAPTIEREEDFDAKSYLQANPDVAANWSGSAWSHYVAYGRKEHRFLDPTIAARHVALMFFYNYTIPLGAVLANVPVVNGLSGWQPPQWNLFDVLAPDANTRLHDWLAHTGQNQDSVCVVPLALDWSMLGSINPRP